jgi:energy-coupling factor transporter ATP-binding protein EcfA2
MLEVELLNVSDKIQVRGTPGCGKTTLAKLLQVYILRQEPNARVTYVRSWVDKNDMPRRGWKDWLKLKLQPGTVLIVDEAQSSYWDKRFWLELKDINPETSSRVVTLSSYGSAGHNIYDPMTPFYISPRQNIGLLPVDHGDQITVGLLLTKAEFDEVVLTLFQKHQFDISLLDSVFDVTRGHVGACEDFLRAVLAHPVSRFSWTNDLN